MFAVAAEIIIAVYSYTLLIVFLTGFRRKIVVLR